MRLMFKTMRQTIEYSWEHNVVFKVEMLGTDSAMSLNVMYILKLTRYEFMGGKLLEEKSFVFGVTSTEKSLVREDNLMCIWDLLDAEDKDTSMYKIFFTYKKGEEPIITNFEIVTMQHTPYLRDTYNKRNKYESITVTDDEEHGSFVVTDKHMTSQSFSNMSEAWRMEMVKKLFNNWFSMTHEVEVDV